MLPRSMASPEKNKKQVRLCSPARIHAFSQGSCPKHSCLCLSCILELEAKRKERSQVVYERKKQLNKLRAKAEKVAEEKLGAQLEILAPVKY
ncbi:hypothetical protein F2Q69_00056010 [Brassica cretica]|uniref:Uncharacterized protein n=1 Tax=Brassica cretica TaxID=69181 RepID=A0A8S9MVN4_BRACR|nr:hypothetical protein F2Q69_00056010 [Brassica cretica]